VSWHRGRFTRSRLFERRFSSVIASDVKVHVSLQTAECGAVLQTVLDLISNRLGEKLAANIIIVAAVQ